jgi:hypothetical protein
VNRSADRARLTTDPVSLKPETSTENLTLEFFGGPPSVLFRAFRVVQSLSPINTGFIWKGGTQHDALRRDLEDILVPRLAHPPKQMTIAATRLDDESVDLMRHGFPAPNYAKDERQTTEVNAWENATHTNHGWTRYGDRDSSDTRKISKVQRGHLWRRSHLFEKCGDESVPCGGLGERRAQYSKPRLLPLGEGPEGWEPGQCAEENVTNTAVRAGMNAKGREKFPRSCAVYF